MSAVFEEKSGSSKVQRSSVPAGTRMSCAFVLACTPRNNTEIAKYAEIRRMCYLPVRRPGRTCSRRKRGDARSEDEREECTAGTHPIFAPRISSRSVSGNYSSLRKLFNRQDLRALAEKEPKRDHTRS